MTPSTAHALKALRAKVLGGALPARGGMWMAVDLRDAKAESGFSDRQFAGHLEALAALDLFHASSQAVGLVRLPSIQTEASTHDQSAPTPQRVR